MRGAAWQRDTLVHVWSCTKAVTSLCAHLLASRGQLDLDAPVVQYWPEFGQNGKQNTTVEMLMSHKAGVPAIRDPLPMGAMYDWDFMVDSLPHGGTGRRQEHGGNRQAPHHPRHR